MPPVITRAFVVSVAGGAGPDFRILPEIISPLYPSFHPVGRQVVSHPLGLLVLFTIGKGIVPVLNYLVGSRGGQVINRLRAQGSDSRKKDRTPQYQDPEDFGTAAGCTHRDDFV